MPEGVGIKRMSYELRLITFPQHFRERALRHRGAHPGPERHRNLDN